MNYQENIKRNIDGLLTKIETAAVKAGRKADDITLVAVSKTHPAEKVMAAYEAGLRIFGENRIIEAQEKFRELPPDIQLHLIGHIQTNKSRTAAEIASCIEAVDSLKIAVNLDRHLAALNKKMDILIEYKVSDEENKTGFDNEDSYFQAVEEISRLKNLNIKGLMTIAPFTDDEKKLRAAFSLLRRLFEKTSSLYTELDFKILSMGMSGDYQLAVEEGSTHVRIGTAIFGVR
jgi:hypothetical protein